MYSRERIAELHAALERSAGGSLVLLGGSYLYGDATESSDVDFYCIAPLFRVRSLWSLFAKVFAQYQGVDANVMFVPKFVFRLGWYYIYGADTSGRIFISRVNKKVIIRNCLKKCLYRLLVYKKEGGKGSEVLEAAKQLAVCFQVRDSWNLSASIFSTEQLLEFLASSTRASAAFLKGLLERKKRGETYVSIDEYELMKRYAFEAVGMCSRELRWSFSNYLLYNTSYLRHGNGLFLFKNPDKMILKQLALLLRADCSDEDFRSVSKLIFATYSIHYGQRNHF